MDVMSCKRHDVRYVHGRCNIVEYFLLNKIIFTYHVKSEKILWIR